FAALRTADSCGIAAAGPNASTKDTPAIKALPAKHRKHLRVNSRLPTVAIVTAGSGDRAYSSWQIGLGFRLCRGYRSRGNYGGKSLARFFEESGQHVDGDRKHQS